MPRLKNTHPHCLLSSGREIGGKLRPFFCKLFPKYYDQQCSSSFIFLSWLKLSFVKVPHLAKNAVFQEAGYVNVECIYFDR